MQTHLKELVPLDTSYPPLGPLPVSSSECVVGALQAVRQLEHFNEALAGEPGRPCR
jgi:hypothetical protein